MGSDPGRILLIGIDGLYNYGCEAIVRGTHALIQRQFPGTQLVYASPRPAVDAKRIADIDVKVVTRELTNRATPPVIASAILRRMGIPFHARRDSLRPIRDVDAVMLIGGDIYTIYSNDAYPGHLIKYGDAVLAAGKPYIVWGASIGPFTQRPEVERKFKAHLQHLPLITVRDVSTLEYLDSLGIRENVVSCSDPAFAVAPDVVTTLEGPTERRIALNLSPLSVRYVGGTKEQALQQSAVAIENIVKRFNCRVLLVPHVVIESAPHDDDLHHLKLIRDHLPAETKSRVDLLEGDLGFVGTKRELAKCTAVVAARMHCAISALSACVPTILLSYSEKSIGMSKYVFGSPSHAITLRELGSDSFMNMLDKLVANRTAESQFLLDQRERISTDAENAVNGLQKCCARSRQ
ncbi:MAG: polysaccharide pyruvyl transferase family protein [Pirellulaceae bacterium]|nr:polysaccharide pyruvyl transferase family protein [Planctomycetales bacterium]